MGHSCESIKNETENRFVEVLNKGLDRPFPTNSRFDTTPWLDRKTEASRIRKAVGYYLRTGRDQGEFSTGRTRYPEEREKILNKLRAGIKENRDKWGRDSKSLVISMAMWETISKFITEADVNALGLYISFTPDDWPEGDSCIL
jgi:hypothetical protein